MRLNIIKKGLKRIYVMRYPGVNYVTCLELSGDVDKAMRLVPAVECAVLSKMKRKEPDYWDYATLLELAVIENRFEEAEEFYWEAKPLANRKLDVRNYKRQLRQNHKLQENNDGENTAAIEKISAMLS